MERKAIPTRDGRNHSHILCPSNQQQELYNSNPRLKKGASTQSGVLFEGTAFCGFKGKGKAISWVMEGWGGGGRCRLSHGEDGGELPVGHEVVNLATRLPRLLVFQIFMSRVLFSGWRGRGGSWQTGFDLGGDLGHTCTTL